MARFAALRRRCTAIGHRPSSLCTACLALPAHRPKDRPMAGRRSRGKPRVPQTSGTAVPPEEATMPFEVTPELLDSMADESERPTLRLPARPPFADPEDEAIAR